MYAYYHVELLYVFQLFGVFKIVMAATLWLRAHAVFVWRALDLSVGKSVGIFRSSAAAFRTNFSGGIFMNSLTQKHTTLFFCGLRKTSNYLALSVVFIFVLTVPSRSIVPRTTEGNFMSLAYQLPSLFLGDKIFETCARLWRQNKFTKECADYHDEIRLRAEAIDVKLTRKLLMPLIDIYLEIIDELYPACEILSESNHDACAEQRETVFRTIWGKYENGVIASSIGTN